MREGITVSGGLHSWGDSCVSTLGTSWVMCEELISNTVGRVYEYCMFGSDRFWSYTGDARSEGDMAVRNRSITLCNAAVPRTNCLGENKGTASLRQFSAARESKCGIFQTLCEIS